MEIYSSAAGLIFDCDGTLADTMPLHWKSWQTTAQKFGFHFPEERFYQLGGVPSIQILEQIIREQSLSFVAAEAAEAKESAYLSMINEVRPIDEVVAIANHFSGKIPLAVASGGTREVIESVLNHMAIRQLFSAVVTSESVQRQKPHPDIFLEAARQLEAEPAMCIGFEDADLGMQAISAAGMMAVHVNSLRKIIPSGAKP